MLQAAEKGNILVIDDEESTLAMLRLLLAADGYAVLTARSGEAGWEIFRKQGPGIVLTDIRMPGMDGIELLKRLKQEDSKVEVIVITGHGDMDLAVQALQHGASDFINKPVAKRSLDIALERAREKIHLRQQLEEYTDNLEARVQEATAELDKSCRRLQTLCEIHRAVGEMPSLGDILGFLHQRIESITGLRSRLILVLSGQGDRVLDHLYDPGAVRVTDHLVTMIQELDRPRLLTDEERRQIFLDPPPAEGEETAVLPIWIRDEAPVGIAFVGTAAAEGEDDLRFATLLLSQAAGAIRRAARQEEELRALRQQAGVEAKFGDLIGRHQKMQTIYRLIAGIAESEASVLIQGESGTGKELIAKLLHQLSPHRDQPFVVINCGAYPPTLIESELFGHERGAFTGAVHARRGCFEQANGGTIFLDEIGEVPTEAQVKLLRVLQFKEFQRLGGETTIKVEVRVVAATSKDLRREMEVGRFREDLYYRLHVIPITVPPLRERLSDLPLLAEHFLRLYSKKVGKSFAPIRPDVMKILMSHDWPGNVRELENVIEHAAVLAQGEAISPKDLPAYLQEPNRDVRVVGESLEAMERQHLLRVLDECQGNKNLAASRLGISRSTLYRKLERYGLHQ